MQKIFNFTLNTEDITTCVGQHSTALFWRTSFHGIHDQQEIYDSYFSHQGNLYL